MYSFHVSKLIERICPVETGKDNCRVSNPRLRHLLLLSGELLVHLFRDKSTEERKARFFERIVYNAENIK